MNEDVVIYGLGGVRDTVERSLKSQNYVYSDSFAEIKSFKGKRFIPKTELREQKWKILIIAIGDIRVAKEIEQDLRRNRYINEDCHIIVFTELIKSFYSQKVDKVLKNYNKPVKGVVLGISHASLAVNTDILEGWINLSCRSQDIFYNFETLKYLFDKKELSDCRDIVFEMYDYNYFNYDVSLSASAVKHYYTQGGFNKHPHNFDRNIHFNYSFEQMKENEGLSYSKDETIEIEKLFDTSSWIKHNYSGYDDTYRNTININSHNQYHL